MFISVVVAVRDESQYIEKCIRSLCTQTYVGPYEVIVVDGMSTDGTYELLQELQKSLAFTLLRNPKLNAAVGRNNGIAQAKGDHIAFIDGDAIAAPDWLTQIEAAFQKSHAVGVGGPDLLPEDGSELARMIGLVMTSPLASGGRFNPSTQHVMRDEEQWVEHIPTVNLCLKREVFAQVGKFDERFVKGQDLELSYRIVQAGYKLFYSPRIKVVHYRKETLGAFTKQIYKWAEAKVAILKKHGMQGLTSHVYLWPAYAFLAFSLVFLVFFSLNLTKFFLLLLLIVAVIYTLAILFESWKIMIKFDNRTSFMYALALLPILHISYGFGVMTALIKGRCNN